MKLTLGEGLSVNAEEFLESATALVSQRGRGKSGGVRVIEEELLEKRLPFVTIDPVGLHWGLRSSFDGKKPSGYELLVVGGEHGDLPLERRGGEDIARGIIEDHVPAVIDLNGQSKGAQREFVRDFADGLYRLNNASRLVILEETPEFCPQRLLSAEIAQAFEAVERIVRLGRNKGLGALLVGQRPATINKDLLTQVDTIICLGINSPQDRKALKEWVEQNAEPERLKEFMEGITSLERQEAWVWSPAQLKLFKRFRFRDFTTLHPDKTHLRRLGLLKTTPVQTDVSGLVSRLQGTMKALAERRVADDPRALRARVAGLERELAKAQDQHEPKVRVEERRVEVPALKDSQVKRLEALAARADAVAERVAGVLAKTTQQLREASAELRAGLARKFENARPPSTTPLSVGRPVLHTPQAPRLSPLATGKPTTLQASRTRAALADDATSLGRGERLTLIAIAQHPQGCSREQLTVLVGYKRSSRDAYLARLRERGFIEERAGRQLATESGIAFLGGDYEPLPVGQALIDYWLRRLPEGERRVFEFVLGHSQGVAREEIDAAVGYKRSSRDAYISRLSARELVVAERGVVRPSDSLLLEAAI